MTTYDELKAAIADWLDRADLAPVIPQFVALAEAQFNRVLRVRQMIKRATASIESHFTPLPGDFLEAANVQSNTAPGRPLQVMSMEVADRLRADTPNGVPTNFTIVGDTLELVPVPSAPSTIEMTYYARIPALSATTQSNWLLLSSPDLYLYAALLQTAPYLRDDERVTVWAALYESRLDEMRVADERAAFGGSVLIARPRRTY
jgi:hypothetical protein